MKVQVLSPSLNQTLDVNLDLNSTVWNLKEEIQHAHPQHPLPSNQRIIYSGKLLENDDSLSSILKKLEGSVVPTFHLVVKPSLLGSKQTIPATKPMNQDQPASSFHATSFPSSIPNIQAGASTTAPSSAPLPQNVYPPALPGGYQLVALNGQYYLAPVLVPAEPVPGVNTNMQPNYTYNYSIPPYSQTQGQQEQQQQEQQAPQGHNAGRPIFIRPANAQRAASIWLALKLYFVVFILCQGASLERILLFHAIALVMFMYQTGRLRVVVHRIRVRDPQVRHPPPPPPPQQQQQQQNMPETNFTQPPQAPATRLEILKRGIYMFIASFWPNFGRDPQIAQAFENEQRQA